MSTDDPIKRAAGEAARYLDSLPAAPVSGAARPGDLHRRLAAAYRFDAPGNVAAILDDVARMLARGSVHGTHRAYFGPFHSGVERSAIAASTLVAAYDVNAATHAQGAAAIAIEAHLLRFLGASLGYDAASMAAHFTSGGQEANTEALVVALVRRFPEVRERGLRALDGDPVVYLSAEAHHSFEKAASVCGLGRASVRRIPVDRAMRLDLAALATAIDHDRRASRRPFFVVGTAGTTASGAIDPLDELAAFCAREDLWLHVDAAFGGSLALSRRSRDRLSGIERADSISWDAHKSFPIPLTAGMYFTRHGDAPRAAFDTESGYMPRPNERHVDPYRESLAWSRRAYGIPLFVVFAERGAEAIGADVERTIALGDRLRERLRTEGFFVHAGSVLPVVCFSHPRFDADAPSHGEVARAIKRRGRAFVSPATLGDGTRVLRACLSNATTDERDLDVLVDELRAVLAS